jgi:hypothetical protein
VLAAQKPNALGKPNAEYKEPFTQISAVRELSDGRVLVADARDKTVQFIDFKSGTATKVGRDGSGPGEYGNPQRIVALPLDTSAIYDPMNQRYVIAGPEGMTGKEFRLEEAIEGRGARGGGRGSQPKGSDSRGRIFYEGPPFTFTPDGMIATADSAPVLRFDRQMKRSDTVAYVHLAKDNARISGNQNRVEMIVGLKAFPTRDDWAPMPDGSVAIVRVRDYHVDWYAASGKRTSGPRVVVDAIPVTEADKEEVRVARRMPGVTLGPGGAAGGRPPVIPDPEFPAFKPPFVLGGVFARPNGQLWVLRSRKAGDKIPVYDVFDATGSMTARMAFPEKTRLVGFGNGTVYVVRNDEDDLQYLQRYTLP